MVRDIEVDKIVRETIPDILKRLEALEQYNIHWHSERETVEVEEKDGIYEYEVLPDEFATSSV